MKTIHKYVVGLNAEFEILMPRASQILCIQEQGSDWVMWAIVDTTLPLTRRVFRGFWTGEELPDCFHTHVFIATIQDYYVWHIFELVNPAVKDSVINTMNNNFDPAAKAEEVKDEAAAIAPAEQATEETGNQEAPKASEGEGALVD